MKFCDKLYVGFQRERYQSSDTPRVLGFAVPYGTTKAEQNRIENVDRWSGNKEDCRIIDNTPTRGFKLLEVVSRYRTNNKLFRVLDPRGFELEISADNLLDLAMASTIVKGEIVEECVWAQHHGAYLMPTSSDEYQFWKGSKSKPKTKIEDGKYYVNVGNLLSVFRFEGIYHHTYVDYKHVATDHKVEYGEHRGMPQLGKREMITVTSYKTNVNVKMNSGNKPSYIYTEFVLDDDGNLLRKSIHARKSHFKNLKEYDQELPNEVLEFKPDLMQWIDHDGYYWSNREKYDNLIMNSARGFDGFFKTKEEARNFDYSEIIANLKPDRVDISHLGLRSRYSYYAYADSRTHENATQTFNIVDER